MATKPKSDAIPSLLLLAGKITHTDFLANEIFLAHGQWAQRDVVPVIATVAILTNLKVSLPRNKTTTLDILTTAIKAHADGAKSNFKSLGVCLALCEMLKDEPSLESAMMLKEVAKTYADALNNAFKATKPAKPATATAPDAPTPQDAPAPDLATAPQAVVTLDTLSPSDILRAALVTVHDAIETSSISLDDVALLISNIEAHYKIKANGKTLKLAA